MVVKGWRRGDLCMQTRRIATRSSGKIVESRGGKREREKKGIKSMKIERRVSPFRCPSECGTGEVHVENRSNESKYY